MSWLRAGVTFVIVLLIVLLSAFQMQLRGYDKIGRINEYVLYYKNEAIEHVETEIFRDGEDTYYLPSNNEHLYLVKSGFQEFGLLEALDDGLITIQDLVELGVVYKGDMLE